MLADGHFMSIADRSILSCWGVNGGQAGRPFQVTINPGTPDERAVAALADGEFVPAGTLIRIQTTGGGGWGDPLSRSTDLVLRDVAWGKVSPEAAVADYGVVITGSAPGPSVELPADQGLAVDLAATERLRATLRAGRPQQRPFFDRGPGYQRLAGLESAEVDWL